MSRDAKLQFNAGLRKTLSGELAEGFHIMKISTILLSSLLVFGAACGEKKVEEGSEKAGEASAEAIPSATQKENPNSNTIDSPTPVKPDVPSVDVAAVIAKLTWKPVTQYKSPKIYSGFDGVNSFKTVMVVMPMPDLPEELFDQVVNTPEFMKAYFEKLAKITVEGDAAAVGITEIPVQQQQKFFRAFALSSKKAGESIVKPKLDAAEAPHTLMVAAYTPEQIAAGRARYNTAVEGATPSPSCASCHRAQGGVNHSPLFTAQYSDAGILSSVENGQNADDGYTLPVTHRMTFATPEAKAGIVPYLRSLDPLANGNIEVPEAPPVTPAAFR